MPLVSLGYMCAKGWRGRGRLNPGGAKVRLREYVHDPAQLSLRGGPGASDHVNILGNEEMLADILRVVTGREVEERVHSEIFNIVDKIDL